MLVGFLALRVACVAAAARFCVTQWRDEAQRQEVRRAQLHKTKLCASTRAVARKCGSRRVSGRRAERRAEDRAADRKRFSAGAVKVTLRDGAPLPDIDASNKCLQRAVADALPRPFRAQARGVFARRCANHAGTGLRGTRRERHNFVAVRNWLKSNGLFVWVVASESEIALRSGRVDGKWRLGSHRGRCGGVLFWDTSASHVRVMRGHAARLVRATPEGHAAARPWVSGVAGARTKRRRRAAPQEEQARGVPSSAAAGQAEVPSGPGPGGAEDATVAAPMEVCAASEHDEGELGPGELARMTFRELENWCSAARRRGDSGAPNPRPRVGGRRTCLPADQLRRAIAAHVGIDLDADEGPVGAAARSGARDEETLATLAAFVAEHGRVPRRRAEDADERVLAKWADNVTAGQNALSAEHQRRFEELLGDADGRRDARNEETLAAFEAFATNHGALPRRRAEAADECALAVWAENVKKGHISLSVEHQRRFEELVGDAGERAADREGARFREYAAWCDATGRCPRERATDNGERALAKWAANHIRGVRSGSQGNWFVAKALEDMQDRFRDDEGGARALRARAEAQRQLEAERVGFAGDAEGADASDLDAAPEADEGVPGDEAPHRRGVNAEAFQRMVAADAALPLDTRLPLCRALMARVEAMPANEQLGAELFQCLADSLGWAAVDMSEECRDYVRYMLVQCFTDVPLRADVFGDEGSGAAASDPARELPRLRALLEVAAGRAGAAGPPARAQAIRRLRRECPDLLRGESVPGSAFRDRWDQWQDLLYQLEMRGVERTVRVCCYDGVLPCRVPLRPDGAPCPARVPLLPSLDAQTGSVWWPDDRDEDSRRHEYKKYQAAEAARQGWHHGSVILRLAQDFMCAKCQVQFLAADNDAADMTDAAVRQWWQRLCFSPRLPALDAARGLIAAEQGRGRRRCTAMSAAADGDLQAFMDALTFGGFDSEECRSGVAPVQRAALQPWREWCGEDGGAARVWPRVLGIRRRGAAAWFAEGVESRFPELVRGMRGFYTGAPGYVPPTVWLLRAWCQVRGGVARAGEAGVRLLQAEGEWDTEFAVDLTGAPRRGGLPVYLMDLKPEVLPDKRIWFALCSGHPTCAAAVRAAVRAERAAAGVDWRGPSVGWNLDVSTAAERMHTLGAWNMSQERMELWTTVCDLRSQQGRWPRQFRRGPSGFGGGRGGAADSTEHRAALALERETRRFVSELLEEWRRRTLQDWLAVARRTPAAATDGGGAPASSRAVASTTGDAAPLRGGTVAAKTSHVATYEQ